MADMVMGKKLQDKMGSSMNESRAAPMGKFGAKMLEKMGWKEGDGLGKNNDGMKEHIKIKKREEAIGLGADNGAAVHTGPADGWWMDAYSDSIKNLKSNKKKKDKKDKKDKKKRKKDGSDDDENDKDRPSFDDLFKATGGVRLGMRARGDQSAKFRRTEGAEALEKLKSSVANYKQDSDTTPQPKKEKKEKKEKKSKKEK